MRIAILCVSFTALLAACGEPAAPAAPDASRPPPAPTDPATPGQASVAPAPGEQGGTDDWREVVTAEDASRIDRLDEAWRQARAEADERGFGDQIAALGPLADPDAGQAGRLQPPPGDYRCRTFLIGSPDGRGLGFIPYGWFRCSVELTPGGDLILTKTTGSQRPRGLLYPDGDRRLVFVGATALGSDETAYPAYGQTPGRDQVGVLERIGPQRWRLVLPWPRQDAKLRIMEIVR